MLHAAVLGSALLLRVLLDAICSCNFPHWPSRLLLPCSAAKASGLMMSRAPLKAAPPPTPPPPSPYDLSIHHCVFPACPVYPQPDQRYPPSLCTAPTTFPSALLFRTLAKSAAI